jgi:hypothetical protein
MLSFLPFLTYLTIAAYAVLDKSKVHHNHNIW